MLKTITPAYWGHPSEIRANPTDQLQNQMKTSFCNMIAIKERHFCTRLHPHFVLTMTANRISLLGHIVRENLRR